MKRGLKHKNAAGSQLQFGMLNLYGLFNFIHLIMDDTPEQTFERDQTFV